MTIREPDTATAYEKPCELYAYHAPAVVRTQGHHRHPQYLQIRAFGRLVDAELLWLCGSCHDAVHEWIGYLLGESRRPSPEPGRLAKAEAQRSVDWFRKVTAERNLEE